MPQLVVRKHTPLRRVAMIDLGCEVLRLSINMLAGLANVRSADAAVAWAERCAAWVADLRPKNSAGRSRYVRHYGSYKWAVLLGESKYREKYYTCTKVQVLAEAELADYH
jgi:hypothetical protein